VLDSGALAEELVGGLLDGSLGDLVIKVQAGDGSVCTWGGGAREREHDALRDVVESAVSLEGDGLPLGRAEGPVAHVVDGGVTGGGSGRHLSELNDLSTTLLNARSELIRGPAGINEGRGVSTGDLGVSDIGVHGGRVVTPDGHLLDVGDLGVGLKSKLSEGSVVIKTGHGGEAGRGHVRSVVLADERVGVGGVADDDGLAITGGVVVDGTANIDEDLAVVLKEISTLHSWATGLGTDEEVVVNILEGGGEIAGDHNLVEEREGTVMKLSLDTLEDLLLEGEIEKVEDDTLVLSEEFTRGDSVDDRVGDLASSTGNEDAHGLVVGGGSRGGHGSLGDTVETGHLVEGS